MQKLHNVRVAVLWNSSCVWLQCFWAGIVVLQCLSLHSILFLCLCFLRILTAELGWLFARMLVTPGNLILLQSYLSLSSLPSCIIFMLWKVSAIKLETLGFAFAFWFSIDEHFVSPWIRLFRKKKNPKANKPPNFTCGALLVKQVCPCFITLEDDVFHAVL